MAYASLIICIFVRTEVNQLLLLLTYLHLGWVCFHGSWDCRWKTGPDFCSKGRGVKSDLKLHFCVKQYLYFLWNESFHDVYMSLTLACCRISESLACSVPSHYLNQWCLSSAGSLWVNFNDVFHSRNLKNLFTKCRPFCFWLNFFDLPVELRQNESGSLCAFLLIIWLILGLHPANERHHYIVTLSLIGWVQTCN